MSGGLSGEYVDDEMYPTPTPGRRMVARGQKFLNRAGVTTDPWHHEIYGDERGGGGGGGREEEEEEGFEEEETFYHGDPERRFDMYGGKHGMRKKYGYPGGGDYDYPGGDDYDYYNSGAALSEGNEMDFFEEDEDIPEDEDIGVRVRRRFGRLGRMRRRRRFGGARARRLARERSETKQLQARKKALQKRLRQKESLERRASRRQRREARRAARLERSVAKEESRQERLRQQIARLEQEAEAEGLGAAGDLAETLPGESNYSNINHNLRFEGLIPAAVPEKAIITVNGNLSPGKSVYDTDIGRAFFHRILEHDDQEFIDSREEATDFMSEQFGIEFEDAEEHPRTKSLTLYSGHGADRKAVAKLEAFTINTDLKTSVDSIQGFGEDAKPGAATYEGGWKATLLTGATLHGVYGGDQGKRASKGDTMFYLETHIKDKNSEVPVIIHMESPSPLTMSPSNGKIETVFDAQYIDLLHPDSDPVNGLADRTIRLTEKGRNCDVDILTHVKFDGE